MVADVFRYIAHYAYYKYPYYAPFRNIELWTFIRMRPFVIQNAGITRLNNTHTAMKKDDNVDEIIQAEAKFGNT